MAMMMFLSRGVEVPYAHRTRVVDYGFFDTNERVQALFPFKMRSDRFRPRNAFAAVEYENYWFSIAHDDIPSKRALESVMILFQLKAPPTKSSAPLLTLPTR